MGTTCGYQTTIRRAPAIRYRVIRPMVAEGAVGEQTWQRHEGPTPSADAVRPVSVRFHPLARAEVEALPARERKAIDSALDKLAALGPVLPFPHSSKIMGDPGGSLREPRPRAGRSAWRCIYERIGDVFVVGAVGPEARRDKAGFDGAVSAAKARLGEIES